MQPGFLELLWRQLQRPEWTDAVIRHLELSLLSLALGIAISVPLAVAVSRRPRAALLAVNVTNLGRGVPDLALLALGLVVFGLGFKPAVAALVLACLPPIVINTITALRGVDAGVIDSARGMGFSESGILVRVQLPLAAPVIFAGIRTAAVQVVAGATLATFIGAGGLGNFIVEGIAGLSYPTMLAGAIPVAVLAMIVEFLFGGLERLSTPKGLKLARKKG